jgi:acetolactate synthase-1/2/3 large subunit
VRAPRGLIVPSDFQSMGFGLPAAIGAKLAAPERPVVAVIGDGGFAMSGLELLTAVREELPLTVIVFVDNYFNRIRLEQLARYGRTASTAIRNPDFEALARAVGARHVRADGNAEDVLAEATSAKGVTLVEVPVRDSLAVQLARTRGLALDAARRAHRVITDALPKPARSVPGSEEPVR